MEGNEPLPVRADEQVIKPMMDVVESFALVRYGGDLGQAEDERGFAGLEVDEVNAFIFRGGIQAVGVRDADVAVARAENLQAGEIEGEGAGAVRTECIDGVRDGAKLSGFGIQDAAHVAVAFAVIPQDIGSGLGDPLQHASLLPSPGAAGSQFDPSVIVRGIDHADTDGVSGAGGAMFEVDLIREDETVGWIEGLFVIVAEPMKGGAPTNGADGWKRGCGGFGVVDGRQEATGRKGAEGGASGDAVWHGAGGAGVSGS